MLAGPFLVLLLLFILLVVLFLILVLILLLLCFATDLRRGPEKTAMFELVGRIGTYLSRCAGPAFFQNIKGLLG